MGKKVIYLSDFWLSRKMLVKEFTCCLWKILNLAFLFDLRYNQVSVTWVNVWKNEWMKRNTSCCLVIDKVNEERGKLLFCCELGVKCLVVYYSYHKMHTTCWFMEQKQAIKCFLFPFMFLIWFFAATVSYNRWLLL